MSKGGKPSEHSGDEAGDELGNQAGDEAGNGNGHSRQPLDQSTLSQVRVDDQSDMTREQKAVVIPPLQSTETPQNVQVSSKKGFRWWSAVSLLVAALVTFAGVSVFRSDDDFANRLNAESEGDLTRILASLSNESRSLQEELASLRVAIANAENTSSQSDAQAQEAKDRLNALRVLAGTVPVNGPGLVVNVTDPNAAVTYDHLVDAVQELRDAGAEAISVNGRRIGVSSSFGQQDRSITLDGVVLPTPYVLSAIGPQSTLEGGLRIPGGTLDTLRSLNGVSVEVQRNNSLSLPALEEAPQFRAARPVPPERQ